MRNAIICATGSGRLAIELRWVREVITLAHVTPVPTAPAVILGVTHLGGGIVPVIDAQPAADGLRRRARAGDSAVVIESGEARAAVWVSAVKEVITLRESGGAVTDARGGAVVMVSGSDLLARATQAVSLAAGIGVDGGP
ncbi:MAG TPA: chemotaxis protein CheW [Kofleriaceae bacterium]|nr:chemotaxis protein CheW [Kofleriaceae bacterium]